GSRTPAVASPPSQIVAHFFPGISPWRARTSTAVERPSSAAKTRRRLLDDNRTMRSADPSRGAGYRSPLNPLLGFAHRSGGLVEANDSHRGSREPHRGRRGAPARGGCSGSVSGGPQDRGRAEGQGARRKP